MSASEVVRCVLSDNHREVLASQFADLLKDENGASEEDVGYALGSIMAALAACPPEPSRATIGALFAAMDTLNDGRAEEEIEEKEDDGGNDEEYDPQNSSEKCGDDESGANESKASSRAAFLLDVRFAVLTLAPSHALVAAMQAIEKWFRSASSDSPSNPTPKSKHRGSSVVVAHNALLAAIMDVEDAHRRTLLAKWFLQELAGLSSPSRL